MDNARANPTSHLSVLIVEIGVFGLRPDTGRGRDSAEELLDEADELEGRLIPVSVWSVEVRRDEEDETDGAPAATRREVEDG